jgi:Protein of unknown function (DUF3592)
MSDERGWKRRERWFVPASNPEGYSLTRKEWRRDITVAVVITAALCALAAAWLVSTSLFVRRASKATGTVISLRLEDNTETIWDITASFSDYAGIGHTVNSTWLQRSWRFSGAPINVGDTVTVLYDPAAPERADIDAFESLWFQKLCVTGAVLAAWCAVAFMVLIARYPPGSKLIE